MKKQQTYDWGADPEFFGPQMYYRLMRLVGLVKKYTNGNRILDAGCGDGILTFLLAKNNFRIDAIDTSEKCIAYIKQKNNAAVTAIKGDLANMRYKKNSFDAVVAGEILEHIPNDVKVIQEFYRVLKPGGACIVSTPGKPELWHEIDDISGHVRRYTLDELRKKFTDAGFNILECYYWGFPINGLWHRLVFKPLILKKMAAGTNVTASSGFISKLLKTSIIQKLASNVFHLDRLFDWTGLGEFILLVGTKK